MCSCYHSKLFASFQKVCWTVEPIERAELLSAVMVELTRPAVVCITWSFFSQCNCQRLLMLPVFTKTSLTANDSYSSLPCLEYLWAFSGKFRVSLSNIRANCFAVSFSWLYWLYYKKWTTRLSVWHQVETRQVDRFRLCRWHCLAQWCNNNLQDMTTKLHEHEQTAKLGLSISYEKTKTMSVGIKQLRPVIIGQQTVEYVGIVSSSFHTMAYIDTCSLDQFR